MKQKKKRKLRGEDSRWGEGWIRRT
jgi:hypothetical protein